MLLLWLSHLAFITLIQGSDYETTWTYTFTTDTPIVNDITAHLIGGSTNSNGAWGRLELTVNGDRGTVEAEPWTSSESMVACRHLGYSDVKSTMARRNYYSDIYIEEPSPSFHYRNIKCNGHEENLLECDLARVERQKKYEKVVVLYCFRKETAIQVKQDSSGRHLVTSEFIGRININVFSKYCGGYECFKEQEFGVAEAYAHVICKTPKKPYALSRRGIYSTFQSFSYVCSGQEDHISDCPYKYINGDVNFSFQVFCTGEMTLKIDQEQLLAVINSQEYAIGGLDWDDAAAAVACRSLGIKGVTTLGTNIEHHSDLERLVSHNFSCQGNENNLFECTEYRAFSQAAIIQSMYEGVTVICGNERPEVELTMKVQSRAVGRVQALVDGMLGCVCDYGWSEKAARVACNMIGQGSGQVIALLDASAQGLGEIEEYEFTWVRYTYCKGDEKHLWDCLGDVYPYEASPCPEDHLAGIVCGVTKTEIQISLAGGSHSGEGRVVVTIDGVAGSIGWQDWDDEDATVVCKMLGFTNSSALTFSKTDFGSNNGPLYFDNVPCTGKEEHILDCFQGKMGWTTKIPRGEYHLVAGVLCTDSSFITGTPSDRTTLLSSIGLLAALLVVFSVGMIVFASLYCRRQRSPSNPSKLDMVNKSRTEPKVKRESEMYEDLDELQTDDQNQRHYLSLGSKPL